MKTRNKTRNIKPKFQEVKKEKRKKKGGKIQKKPTKTEILKLQKYIY